MRRLSSYSLESICRAAGDAFVLVPKALDKLPHQPGILKHAHRRIEGMPWTDPVSRIGQNGRISICFAIRTLPYLSAADSSARAATRPMPRRMAFAGKRSSASGKKISPVRRPSGR
jgi:hypothetical protein